MTTETTALRKAAAKAVEDLWKGRSAIGAPEHDPGWNEAFVAAIRRLKDDYRDGPDLGPLLEIVAHRLYGKEIHWALELIQNAEDAGARRICFEFDRDQVRVYNDGAPFTVEDVWVICSAGHSRKKNKIGFFGIGFKSVYNVTHFPEIRSGPYALQLEGKIYPSPLPLTESADRGGALFVLPVRDDRRERIVEMINQLTHPDLLHLLLTLDHLDSLEVVDRIGERSGHFHRERVSGDPKGHWAEYRIGGTWPGFEDQTWRRYRFETADVPADVSREGREFEPGDRSRIVLARHRRLHCYTIVS